MDKNRKDLFTRFLPVSSIQSRVSGIWFAMGHGPWAMNYAALVLLPQRRCGVEAGCRTGRVVAKKDPHHCRNAKTKNDRGL